MNGLAGVARCEDRSGTWDDPTEPVDEPGGDGWVGRVLAGTYRVERPLARGGMGVLFAAEHLRLHREVAIKVMSSQHAASPMMRARFEREAHVVSRLEHPHVVQVLDFDVTDAGEPYLVTELLHGETLEDRLERERRVPPREAIRVALQMASGLAAVHAASIIHRDLKPSNVFLSRADGEEPFVKLIDFGISKDDRRQERRLTATRQVVGTPEYMAPEQAMGRETDARADQFALGVVTYEMLTGRQPFTGDSVLDVLMCVVNQTPPPVTAFTSVVPAEVAAVIARALAKQPDERFADVTAFAHALADAWSRRMTSAPPSVVAARPDRFEALAAALGAPHEHVLTRSAGAEARAANLSPRSAFLLSRLEGGVTVEEALDVAAMPRAEALRLLADLMSSGLVHCAHEKHRAAAPRRGPISGYPDSGSDARLRAAATRDAG